MKGLTLERDKAIGVVMLLVIIVIVVIWASNINTAQAQITYRSIIYMHCKEWQDTQCDPTAAESIKIEIEGSEPKYFAELCAIEYDNRPNVLPANKQWIPYGYEGCKKLCMGCPKNV
jgi:hypothetical protein